jgi:hypothetical protein
MKNIEYRGQEFTCRIIANGALISTLSLWNDLEEDMRDTYRSHRACMLDESISGYVSDEEINLPQEKLESLCREYGIID